MGSQAIQGYLWGRRPQDWANIQEKTGDAGYQHVLALPEFKKPGNLLDVGCGTGIFCSLAQHQGHGVTGIDATDQFIAIARERAPGVHFSTGEMESLPFDDASFDLVTGFNSFQYAADVKNALIEARRVLKDGGRLAVMIWGNKEDCEAATYLKAIGSLLPPPPPGAPGPFALTENDLLRTILQEAGFKFVSQEDIATVWDYENSDIALKGLLSVGPATRAIENSGFEKVHQVISEAIIPYTRTDGHVVYHNKFRIAIAEK